MQYSRSFSWLVSVQVESVKCRFRTPVLSSAWKTSEMRDWESRKKREAVYYMCANPPAWTDKMSDFSCVTNIIMLEVDSSANAASVKTPALEYLCLACFEPADCSSPGRHHQLNCQRECLGSLDSFHGPHAEGLYRLFLLPLGGLPRLCICIKQPKKYQFESQLWNCILTCSWRHSRHTCQG